MLTINFSIDYIKKIHFYLWILKNNPKINGRKKKTVWYMQARGSELCLSWPSTQAARLLYAVILRFLTSTCFVWCITSFLGNVCLQIYVKSAFFYIFFWHNTNFSHYTTPITNFLIVQFLSRPKYKKSFRNNFSLSISSFGQKVAALSSAFG